MVLRNFRSSVDCTYLARFDRYGNPFGAVFSNALPGFNCSVFFNLNIFQNCSKAEFSFEKKSLRILNHLNLLLKLQKKKMSAP